jgi:ATP phosphoribosyltransferase
MLRIALPKGRLFEEVIKLLALCGLTFKLDNDRNYEPVANQSGIRSKIIKVRAIPQMVALGNFQVGFCGLDLVVESGYKEIQPLIELGLNSVKLVVAVPRSKADFLNDPPKRPIVIATEYENIAADWAMKRCLAHIIIQTWGSTEGYAPEDADIVFDNTETGRTIEANGLVVVDEIMTSSTWLIANKAAMTDSRYEEDLERLRKSLKEQINKRRNDNA